MKERTERKTAARNLLVGAACIALVVLLVAVIIPEYKLKKAERLIASGDCEAAYALLEGMEYKNSAELAADCLFPAQKSGS